MEKINKLDHDLFLYLNNLGSQAWDPFWLFMTDKWSNIPFYALLLILLIRVFNWKTVGLTLIAIAVLITCTDQLANVFKHAFERLRPCRQEGVMEQVRFIAERCGRFGFFSAHAASSTALAVFMAALFRKRLPWVGYMMVIWAVIVSYSRIYVGVHYPGDVLAGIAIGALLAGIIYYLFTLVTAKYNFLNKTK